MKKNYNPLIGELFIDPTCDVGFKKLMSDEEILIDFLNTFLPKGTPEIVSATLLPEERLAESINSRKVYFDVRAKDNFGKIYIIEIQRKPQEFFVNRSIYYNSREISSQGEVGKLETYDFCPVYSISVLNFVPNEKWANKYYNFFTYREEESNEKLTDMTAQIFILLPLMKLSPEELKDKRSQWCYLLRNAVRLNKEAVSKLKWTQKEIFEKMKTILYVSKLSKEEQEMIDRIRQIEWDNRAVMHEARTQGKREGLEEGLEQGLKQGLVKGRLEELVSVVGNMLSEGFDIKIIAKCVNLPESKIQEIIASIKKH